MTFVENHPELFERIVRERGEFCRRGTRDCVKRTERQSACFRKSRFYGERLILSATLMGLATSWVDHSIDLELASSLAWVFLLTKLRMPA